MASDSQGFRPTGLYAACVTPFRDDESLDLDRLGSHIEFLLDGGVQGILAVGGSGEYANLTSDERRVVVSETIKSVDGRVPVVVGALSPSTRETLEIGYHAAEVGASALLVLPPYYIKPSFEGVVHHFETVAKETGLNIIVYNIPGRTGWPLELQHLRRLAEITGVTAVKECERDAASISLKIAELDDRMALLSGDDDLGFATLLAGARGAIWTSPNLCPKLCVSLFNACVEGDLTSALRLNARLLRIFNTFMLPNHPGPLKQAMALVGRPVGSGRTPLALMSESERDGLSEAIKADGANGPLE